MRGLYAIVDTAACRRAHVAPGALAEALLEGGVAAMQLRAKAEGAGEVLAILRDLAARCAGAGVPLFANDRPDLALLAGCAGVHVGQHDLAPSDVLALSARGSTPLRVGLSTHDEAELERALSEPIDYVAVGPVFGTASKVDPEATVGLARALALAARARAVRPDRVRVAIGGIDEENAAQLVGAFDAIAVIGALLPAGLAGREATLAARGCAERLGRAFRVAGAPAVAALRARDV